MYLEFQDREPVTINDELYEFDRWLDSSSNMSNAPDELQFIRVKGRRAIQISLDEFDRLYQLGKAKFGASKLHPSDRRIDEGEDDRPDHRISEKEKRERLKRRVRRHYLVEYDNNPVPLTEKPLREFLIEA